MGVASPPTPWVAWHPVFRIIPSRYPPVGLFDRVARPEDLEAVLAVEALTNDRLLAEAGVLALVAPEDRISGPGTTPIMAAFTHTNPEGSRFSDGSFGVFYAAKELETAIRETIFHSERFYRRTSTPPIELDVRVYAADLDGRLHDLRGVPVSDPIYAPDSYAASQALGVALHAARSFGVVYRSVRHRGGDCAGVFRPPVLSRCRIDRHLCYAWNGERIARYYEKRGATDVT